MALGFIVFALFCLFVVIVSVPTVIILIKSVKFLLKYRNEHKNQKKTIPFIASIFGIIIGIFLIVILIYGIGLFTGKFSIKTTTTSFTTSNKIKNIEGIVEIEQKLYAAQYHMIFRNISKEVEKIRINSINLIVNENKKNIIDTNDFGKNSEISFKTASEFGNPIEVRKIFKETREVIMNASQNDIIEAFIFMYQFKFDYESVDYVILIYNIDIELKNGEKINIEETSKFNIEIIKEKR